ncbi:MAG: hypothetical protein BWY72_01896 [Bacteroidetes bacterium ADurb.Bin416]|nr:MAG: hypothetical protein BWY72_01896 [Bacteroidetes bacterium ADurb.Bin416]
MIDESTTREMGLSEVVSALPGMHIKRAYIRIRWRGRLTMCRCVISVIGSIGNIGNIGGIGTIKYLGGLF